MGSWVVRAGSGAGRGWRLCERFVEQILDAKVVDRVNSASWSRTSKRPPSSLWESGVGLVAPFSDASQLLNVLALFSRGNCGHYFYKLLHGQTPALVFTRRSTDALVKNFISREDELGSEVGVLAPFALEKLVFL